jgi:hypothetical protein
MLTNGKCFNDLACREHREKTARISDLQGQGLVRKLVYKEVAQQEYLKETGLQDPGSSRTSERLLSKLPTNILTLTSAGTS